MYSAYTQTQVEILKLTSEAKYATCIPPCPLSSLSSLLLLPLPSSLSFLSSFPSSLPLLPSSLSFLPPSLSPFFLPSPLGLIYDSRQQTCLLDNGINPNHYPLPFPHLPSPSLHSTFPLPPQTLLTHQQWKSGQPEASSCQLC